MEVREMRAKHTPGPWTRGGETSDGWYIYAGETTIAKTISSVDEERDNGRLIAAAPELLLACQEALARIESDIESPNYTVREGALCRAAISKAVGPRPPQCAYPRIVCLCGSGRFRETYEQAEAKETLAGNIVLTIGVNTKDVARDPALSGMKPFLDELHLRKIDLADEILVLNVGDYIGESTRNEITYAEKTGKPIRYWEESESPD
jgi:hypothetical protein